MAAAPPPLPPGAAARRRSYLDHASTVPLRPEARAALQAWLDQQTRSDPGGVGAPDGTGGAGSAGSAGSAGDPSRIHADGLAARHAVEQARDQVAAMLGARNREVCFTSGATEAIAAACWGAAERGAHQVVPAVEHSAVREAASRHGEVTLVPPDRRGRVDPGAVLDAVRPDTALVHLQWGNHEVGTLQPVAEVVAACRERGVLVHVDAAQAAGRVPVDFRGLGADLLSVSAHKLGGPPGVGALLIRRGLRLRPLLVGSDQERARRAGHENVPGILGFGAACAALCEPGRLEREAADQRRLTGRILSALGQAGTPDGQDRDGSVGSDGPAARDGLDRPVGRDGDGDRSDSDRSDSGSDALVGGDRVVSLDGLELYGDPDPAGRLPHLVCLGVEGIEPQAVLLGLDRAGISAHSGSACASEGLEPSPVLEAMGVDAHHSLRVSVGWSTTAADVDRLLAALPAVLAELWALDRRTRYVARRGG